MIALAITILILGLFGLIILVEAGREAKDKRTAHIRDLEYQLKKNNR